MARTIIGPTRVATPSGSLCHSAIARWNLGFAGLTLGRLPSEVSWYSQCSGTGSAPHCALNLNVPSFGVERPISKSSAPVDCANWIASQYSRMFAQSELYSRIDDAH